MPVDAAQDDLHYHGFPGGSPVWHFDRPAKPKPAPVTVPTGLYAMDILRLIDSGERTAAGITRGIGLKWATSGSKHIRRLVASGHIARTRNNGRDERLHTLTSLGRAALAVHGG